LLKREKIMITMSSKMKKKQILNLFKESMLTNRIRKRRKMKKKLAIKNGEIPIRNLFETDLISEH